MLFVGDAPLRVDMSALTPRPAAPPVPAASTAARAGRDAAATTLNAPRVTVTPITVLCGRTDAAPRLVVDPVVYPAPVSTSGNHAGNVGRPILGAEMGDFFAAEFQTIGAGSATWGAPHAQGKTFRDEAAVSPAGIHGGGGNYATTAGNSRRYGADPQSDIRSGAGSPRRAPGVWRVDAFDDVREVRFPSNSAAGVHGPTFASDPVTQTTRTLLLDCTIDCPAVIKYVFAIMSSHVVVCGSYEVCVRALEGLRSAISFLSTDPRLGFNLAAGLQVPMAHATVIIVDTPVATAIAHASAAGHRHAALAAALGGLSVALSDGRSADACHDLRLMASPLFSSVSVVRCSSTELPSVRREVFSRSTPKSLRPDVEPMSIAVWQRILDGVLSSDVVQTLVDDELYQSGTTVTAGLGNGSVNSSNTGVSYRDQADRRAGHFAYAARRCAKLAGVTAIMAVNGAFLDVIRHVRNDVESEAFKAAVQAYEATTNTTDEDPHSSSPSDWESRHRRGYDEAMTLFRATTGSFGSFDTEPLVTAMVALARQAKADCRRQRQGEVERAARTELLPIMQELASGHVVALYPTLADWLKNVAQKLSTIQSRHNSTAADDVAIRNGVVADLTLQWFTPNAVLVSEYFDKVQRVKVAALEKRCSALEAQLSSSLAAAAMAPSAPNATNGRPISPQRHPTHDGAAVGRLQNALATQEARLRTLVKATDNFFASFKEDAAKAAKAQATDGFLVANGYTLRTATGPLKDAAVALAESSHAVDAVVACVERYRGIVDVWRSSNANNTNGSTLLFDTSVAQPSSDVGGGSSTVDRRETAAAPSNIVTTLRSSRIEASHQQQQQAQAHLASHYAGATASANSSIASEPDGPRLGNDPVVDRLRRELAEAHRVLTQAPPRPDANDAHANFHHSQRSTTIDGKQRPVDASNATSNTSLLRSPTSLRYREAPPAVAHTVPPSFERPVQLDDELHHALAGEPVGELWTLRSQLSSAQSQLHDTRLECADLDNKLTRCRAQLADASDENIRLVEDNKALRTEVLRLVRASGDLEECRQALDDATHRLAETTQQRDELRSLHESNTVELERLKSREADLAKALESVTSGHRGLSLEVDTLRASNASLRTQLESSHVDRNLVQVEREMDKSTIEKLQNHCLSIETQYNEEHHLRLTNEGQLQSAVAQLQAQLENGRREHSAEMSTLQSMTRERIAMLEDDVQRLKEDLTRASADLHRTRMELESKSVALADVSAEKGKLRAEFERASHDVAELNKQLTERISALSHVSAQHTLLVEERNRLAASVQTLDDENRTLRTRLTAPTAPPHYSSHNAVATNADVMLRASEQAVQRAASQVQSAAHVLAVQVAQSRSASAAALSATHGPNVSPPRRADQPSFPTAFNQSAFSGHGGSWLLGSQYQQPATGTYHAPPAALALASAHYAPSSYTPHVPRSLGLNSTQTPADVAAALNAANPPTSAALQAHFHTSHSATAAPAQTAAVDRSDSVHSSNDVTSQRSAGPHHNGNGASAGQPHHASASRSSLRRWEDYSRVRELLDGASAANGGGSRIAT